VQSPEELSAVVGEALRLVRQSGRVIVIFWHEIVGPRLPSDGWCGSLSEDDVRTWLVDAPGGEAVEPFDSQLSLATRTVPRRLNLDPVEALTSPVAIADGRVLCTGFQSLRRPEGWVPRSIPASRHPAWLARWRSSSRPASASAQALDAASRELILVAESIEPTEGDHSDLRSFFSRWDAVRDRSGLDVAPSGSVVTRGFGFLRRTTQRIRDLGISWDLLRDFLGALVDRHLILVSEVARMRDELAGARRRLEAMEREATPVVGVAVESTVAAGGAAPIDGGAPQESGPSSLPSRREMEMLVRELVRTEGALGVAGSIEVSFATAWAEELLAVALEEWGDRIASLELVGYRSPNDVWIHLDLGAQWPPAGLLSNALPRLARSGSLLLITGSWDEAPAIDGFRLESVVRSRSLPRARIATWRKVEIDTGS
jgi:hypothetical protein